MRLEIVSLRVWLGVEIARYVRAEHHRFLRSVDGGRRGRARVLHRRVRARRSHESQSRRKRSSDERKECLFRCVAFVLSIRPIVLCATSLLAAPSLHQILMQGRTRIDGGCTVTDFPYVSFCRDASMERPVLVSTMLA